MQESNLNNDDHNIAYSYTKLFHLLEGNVQRSRQMGLLSLFLLSVTTLSLLNIMNPFITIGITIACFFAGLYILIKLNKGIKEHKKELANLENLLLEERSNTMND